MDQESIASTRTQRIRKTSSNRLSALEKLKELKAGGLKYKAEVKDVQSIYEEVDEHQYSEIIKSRQDDDWIVDDGTGNYRDDGREIFEQEDETDEDIYQSKKRPRSEVVEKNKYGADIKQMFLASSLKKNANKEPKAINLQQDDILDDIVKELNSTLGTKVVLKNSKHSYNQFHDQHTSMTHTSALFKSTFPATSPHNSTNNGMKFTNQNIDHKIQSYNNHSFATDPHASYPHEGDKKMKKVTSVTTAMSNPDFLDGPDKNDICEGDFPEAAMAHDFSEDFSNDSLSGQKIALTGNVDDFNHKTARASAHQDGFKCYTDVKEDFGLKKSEICNGNVLINNREEPNGLKNKPEQGFFDNMSFNVHKDVETGKSYFLMYWLDAYEDVYNKPGTIYLFGKAFAPELNSYVSCGVVIKNVPRTVYLLPKDNQVPILDVYNEFAQTLAERYKIKKFLSRKVTKKYAFDRFDRPDSKNQDGGHHVTDTSPTATIPGVADYLEVRYDATLSALPPYWPGGSTFNRVLGTKTPGLETFLLQKGIMGPCWLRVNCHDRPPGDTSLHATWCKLEACPPNGPDDVNVHHHVIHGGYSSAVDESSSVPPPLTSLTLSFLTVLNARTKEREIVAVAGVVQRGLSIETGSRQRSSNGGGSIQKWESNNSASPKTPNKEPYRSSSAAASAYSPKISQEDEIECFCVVTRPSDAIFPSEFRRLLSFKYPNRLLSKSTTHNKYPPGMSESFDPTSTRMDVMPSQRALVSYLLAKLHKIDPDILVGFDMANYDLALLLKICQSSKIANWSRIGRLKRSIFPKLNTNSHGKDSTNFYNERQLVCGRLLCDILPNSRDLIKCTSYTLSEICQVVLGEGRFETPKDIHDPNGSNDITDTYSPVVEPNSTPQSKYLYADARTLVRAIRDTTWQVSLLHRVSDQLKILPLAYQLTKISGNVLSRTLSGGRAERNTFLLLHAFYDQGYICPEKVIREGTADNIQLLQNGVDKSTNSGGSKKLTRTKTEKFAGEESSIQEGTRDVEAYMMDDIDFGEDTLFDEDLDITAIHLKDNGHPLKTRKKGPAYTGGLVFEPKAGFYDKFILLLDFNSLYPSIIQEYNICFTTIDSGEGQSFVIDPELQKDIPSLDETGTRDDVKDPPKPGHATSNKTSQLGILPIEIRKLVESRRQIKALMKDPKLKPAQLAQYEIRQKALKLTANSMYGCLGFPASRFYAQPLASLITRKGRDILIHTKELVNKMSLDVIYGDTDSLMVNSYCTDLAQVFKLGFKVKMEVNKLYKYLELDIDGVFKSLLLMKKKKYAALKVKLPCDDYSKVSYEKEVKGLDIIRRDWSSLAKNAGSYVLDQILSDNNREIIVDNIHLYLNDLAEDIKNDKVLLNEFYIHKQLNKNPEDYPDKNSLPHVQVALRMNKKAGKRYRSGDVISYIICQDLNKPNAKSATQRAYHPEEYNEAQKIPPQEGTQNSISEVGERGTDEIDTEAADDQAQPEVKPAKTAKVPVAPRLVLDKEYYLAQQILPVVSRLCQCIDGTDQASLSHFLGIKSTSNPSSTYDSNRNNNFGSRGEDEVTILFGLDGYCDEERFRDVDKLQLVCPGKNGPNDSKQFNDLSQNHTVDFNTIILKNAPEISDTISSRCSLSPCGVCGTDLRQYVPYFINTLTLKIRRHIDRYHQGWLRCDDVTCAYTTRMVPLMSANNSRNDIPCPRCIQGNLYPQYDETKLYDQLCYYESIFDLERAFRDFTPFDQIKLRRMFNPYVPCYKKLMDTVTRYLKNSSYAMIDLGKLFSFCTKYSNNP